MQLLKIGLPDDNSIVARNRFVLNRVYPIAIQPTDDTSNFVILFAGFQDYDETYMYFQAMVTCRNISEVEYFNKNDLNIKNLNEKDTSPKMQEKVKAYKAITNDITSSNLFITDFNMKEDKEFSFYYHAIGVCAIDKSHARLLDLYFPRDNFIKLTLYFKKITEAPSVKYRHENIFRDQKYRNIEYVLIETVKDDATCVVDTELVGISKYITHYEMHCGPSKYIMNFLVVDRNDRVIANPLDTKMYQTFYGNHFNVSEYFEFDNDLFIIYHEFSLVDNSFKKTSALRLKKELADKTNFINRDFIFMDKLKE